MERAFQHAFPEVGVRSTRHDVALVFKQGIRDQSQQVGNLCEPKYVPPCVLKLRIH